MISIVLPVYNGERFLQDAINSVINQTYKEWELIIVNDCSTDKSLEIAQCFSSKDPRIRVISNEVNKKLPGSLNVGFSFAKGEYLTWTSDDNMYKPDALEKMITYLENNPNKALVRANYRIIDSENNDVEAVVLPEPTRAGFLKKNIMGACFLYKREVHEKLKGYDESLFLVEDYDFWVRALRYFEFGYITEELYIYRVHGGSLTSTRLKSIIKGTVGLLDREYNLESESDENKAIILETVAEYCYRFKDGNHFKDNMKTLRKDFPDVYKKQSTKYKMAGVLPFKVVRATEKISSILSKGDK